MSDNVDSAITLLIWAMLFTVTTYMGVYETAWDLIYVMFIGVVVHLLFAAVTD